MYFYIKVDSSYKIGAGHIKRCLKIANILPKKKVIFICSNLQGNLNHLIREKNYKIKIIPKNKLNLDFLETFKIINKTPTEKNILIIDNYKIDHHWEKKIKSFVNKLIVIDDLPRKHNCDYIINQNWFFKKNNLYFNYYSKCKNILFGPNYSIISKIKNEKEKKNKKINILIFFGGSDKKNYTFLFLKKLYFKLNAKINVVLFNKKYNEEKKIKNLIKENSLNEYHIYKNLDNLTPIIKKTNYFIGSSGSTTWDRVYMKIPSLILSTTYDQVNLNKELTNHQIQLPLYKKDLLNKFKIKKKIQEMITKKNLLIKKQEYLIDGHGLERIKLILKPSNNHKINIRKTTFKDKGFLFFCVNQPDAIKSRFNSKYINLSNHENWLKKILKSKNVYFYVITLNKIPIGFFRFDKIKDYFTIDIYIEKNFRNKGISSKALNLGMKKIYTNTKIGKFRAYIKKNNINSLNFFKSLNFKKKENYFFKIFSH